MGATQEDSGAEAAENGEHQGSQREMEETSLQQEKIVRHSLRLLLIRVHVPDLIASL